MTMAIALEWGIRGAVPAVIVAALLLLLRARDPRLEMQLWRSALVFACVMPVLTMLTAVARMAATRTAPPIGAELTAIVATAGTERIPVEKMAAISGDEVLRIGVIVWCSVSMVLLARLGLGAIGAWRLCRTSVAADASLTVDRRVRVSHTLATPATVGSTVLLPGDIMSWSLERRNAVIAHELAHVQHRDFWWQLLARTYAAVCWWNPVAWLFVARLRWLAERLSDAAALRVMPDRQAYAILLVDVAARTRRVLPALHVAMARPVMLRQRVEAVLQHAEGLRLAGTRRLLATSLPLCGACLAAITPMPRAESALTMLETRVETSMATTDSVTIKLYASPIETSTDPEARGRALAAPRSTNRVRWTILNADGSQGASGETPMVITLPAAAPFGVTYCSSEPGVSLLADYKFTIGTSGSHSGECFRIFRERNMTGSRGVPRPRGK